MSAEKKIELQFQNFKAALKKLIEFSVEPIANDRDKAGIIQAFEFTFEQCWKYFQKKAQAMGEPVPGPKPALEVAFRYDWISKSDESAWLSMLMDRNMTSHLYREDITTSILNRVLQEYLPLLKAIEK